ncbi:ABC transporter ATP-binding protein [Jiangella alkaliphila]|uniref:Iron complex transport system ATP-binding protein n=1 Tax=Jiangella alkaliphila TaxID=419479 RepID=A0A1H2LBT8_9ACTN|nr:ABC transporter ATP-binding protein [Jiangella alkaliphila]SDU78274.1 iron complex transport system ATP-binding protein [Jiangella alkaliphila]
MTGDVVLEAVGLVAGYRSGRRRSTPVVAAVTAGLRRGRLVCLLGPNGAGKSTLLRTLVGSQPALGGSVRLDGTELAALSARERAQRLAVVLTDRVDVGLLTARDLVAIGRTPRTGWLRSLRRDDLEVVEWALGAAGAADLAHRHVDELSDGERQRVMVARALAQEPAVLVLDEPTAFLDLTRRVELMVLLRRLADETGLAVLMSMHDLELAMRTADEIWLVHPGGRFQAGAPEDLGADGSIASAYAGDDIRFDHAAGTFVTDEQRGGLPVRVDGDDVAVLWACRAAARAGLTVTPSAPHRVAVESGPSVGWTLTGPGGATSTGSGFAALVDRLKDLDRPLIPPDIEK